MFTRKSVECGSVQLLGKTAGKERRARLPPKSDPAPPNVHHA